jgi:hypothetical protein
MAKQSKAIDTIYRVVKLPQMLQEDMAASSINRKVES